MYLDLAKAFEKVDHKMICHRLHDHGITGKLGEELHDSLIVSNHAIAENGALSEVEALLSGVLPGYSVGITTVCGCSLGYVFILRIIHTRQLHYNTNVLEAESTDNIPFAQEWVCGK